MRCLSFAPVVTRGFLLPLLILQLGCGPRLERMHGPLQFDGGYWGPWILKSAYPNPVLEDEIVLAGVNNGPEFSIEIGSCPVTSVECRPGHIARLEGITTETGTWLVQQGAQVLPIGGYSVVSVVPEIQNPEFFALVKPDFSHVVVFSRGTDGSDREHKSLLHKLREMGFDTDSLAAVTKFGSMREIVELWGEDVN